MVRLMVVRLATSLQPHRPSSLSLPYLSGDNTTVLGAVPVYKLNSRRKKSGQAMNEARSPSNR
ncbi:hypothetical protein JOH51_005502 [Rhizobium leguminosarum]|nr:hypothetical protein [Rhizobium leguminosarum]